MNITAITGSGISAASGIPTYRTPGSNWDKFAHGKAHASRYGNHLPELWVHWLELARVMGAAQPNGAHETLADAGAFVITQNVDRLHSRAGSENAVELHGDMTTLRCIRCKKTSDIDLESDQQFCQHCNSHRVRPNIVLFGEQILRRYYDAAEKSVLDADLVVVIGTSGEVYPARGLVDLAISKGKRTVLFDLEPWQKPESSDKWFSEVVLGPSHETLPEYFASL